MTGFKIFMKNKLMDAKKKTQLCNFVVSYNCWMLLFLRMEIY